MALAAVAHHSAQPSLAEPRGDVEPVQRHTVDQMVVAPLLPTFDVPVPLMVEQLLLGVLSPS